MRKLGTHVLFPSPLHLYCIQQATSSYAAHNEGFQLSSVLHLKPPDNTLQVTSLLPYPSGTSLLTFTLSSIPAYT